MYYKGFKIEPQYLPGSDFKVLKNGEIKNKHPTEIDFYCLTEICTGWKHVNASSVREAKRFIDEVNIIIGK